jgi:hypothetical protein
MKKLDWYLKWVATAITIAGAILTSLNYYPAGPILLNLASLVWLIVSIMWREWSLVTVNGVLLLIYTVGLLVKIL